MVKTIVKLTLLSVLTSMFILSHARAAPPVLRCHKVNGQCVDNCTIGGCNVSCSSCVY